MSMFVTFEGSDGSGKTTQIHLLTQHLRTSGHTVLTTREPGGTRIGDGIRQLLLDLAHTEMNARAETLLFNAARAQIVAEVIRPALAAANIVLCDRFADSTLAYQGYGHRQDIAELARLIEYATGGLRPDLTIYLDYPARRRHPPQPRPRRRRLEPPRRPGAILLSTCSQRLSPADSTATRSAGPSSTPAAPATKSISTSCAPCSKSCPPSRPAAEACPRMRPSPKGLTILQLAKQWPNSSI